MPDVAPSDLNRDALEREVTRLRAELRAKESEIDRLEQDAYDRSTEVEEALAPLDELHEALAALHEQAHGPTSIRFCQSAPCSSLESNYVGPAPASLAML